MPIQLSDLNSLSNVNIQYSFSIFILFLFLFKYCAVTMNKPQDSDIFGTRLLKPAPRIQNDSNIDPNAQLKNRMDRQYN